MNLYVVAHRLFFTCLSSNNTVVNAISRNGVYFIRMFSLFVEVLSSSVIYLRLVITQISCSVQKSMFCVTGNLELPELDKIQTIEKLLPVNGLITSPLFDVPQVDFMLESLCTR